jgi:hypothetical protein
VTPKNTEQAERSRGRRHGRSASRRLATVVAIAVIVALAAFAIPAVIMVEAAAVAFPVSIDKILTIVPWANPACAVIRGPCPISIMPSIVVADRVPVTFNP